MKFFVALALIVVAVCAKTYKYEAPTLPCAYELKMKSKQGENSTYIGKFTVNGHFLRLKVEDDEENSYAVYRPDIKNDAGEIGVAVTEHGECETQYIDEQVVETVLSSLPDAFFGTISSYDWTDKEETEYDGKECTCYYDTDKDVLALYVRKGYPYVLHSVDTDLIYEWDFDVPMDKFALEDCSGDFAKTPDKKYVVCDGSSYDSSATPASEKSKSSGDAASTTKAVAALVFAVIAAFLF
jgi:hypothetical protein